MSLLLRYAMPMMQKSGRMIKGKISHQKCQGMIDLQGETEAIIIVPTVTLPTWGHRGKGRFIQLKRPEESISGMEEKILALTATGGISSLLSRMPFQRLRLPLHLPTAGTMISTATIIANTATP